MPKAQIRRIFSPVGGLNRTLEFQNQPPYTTPAAVNVRPRSSRDGRSRIARRPGLVKYAATKLGLQISDKEAQEWNELYTNPLVYEKTWDEPYTSEDIEVDGWIITQNDGYSRSVSAQEVTVAGTATEQKQLSVYRALPADLFSGLPYTVTTRVTVEGEWDVDPRVEGEESLYFFLEIGNDANSIIGIGVFRIPEMEPGFVGLMVAGAHLDGEDWVEDFLEFAELEHVPDAVLTVTVDGLEVSATYNGQELVGGTLAIDLDPTYITMELEVSGEDQSVTAGALSLDYQIDPATLPTSAPDDDGWEYLANNGCQFSRQPVEQTMAVGIQTYAETAHLTAYRAVPTGLLTDEAYTISLSTGLFSASSVTKHPYLILYAGIIGSTAELESASKTLVMVQITRVATGVQVDLKSYIDGALVVNETDTAEITGEEAPLTLSIEGTTVTATYNETTILTGDLTAPLAVTHFGYRAHGYSDWEDAYCVVIKPITLSYWIAGDVGAYDLNLIRKVVTAIQQTSGPVIWSDTSNSRQQFADLWNVVGDFTFYSAGQPVGERAIAIPAADNGTKGYRAVPEVSNDSSYKFRLDHLIGNRTGGVVYLYFGLNSIDDIGTAGTYIKVTLTYSPTAKTVAIDVNSYIAGMDGGGIGYGAMSIANTYPYVQITIDDKDVYASVQHDGGLWSDSFTLIYSLLTHGMGWKLMANTGGNIGFHLSRLEYTGITYTTPRRVMVFCAGGKTYLQETPGGDVEEASGSEAGQTVALNRSLRGDQMFGAFYIADHCESRLPGGSITDGVVANGTELTSATIGDWEAVGSADDDTAIDAKSDLVVLTKAGETTTHEIASIDGTTINLATAAAVDTGYTVKIERGPKQVNPASGAITNLMAATGRGNVPTNCKLIVQQWGRLILAGDGTTAIYASAVNDPTDWLYADEGMGAAAAWGGPAETRAIIGLQPTALCPYGESNLIVGTADALYALRGDIGNGGDMVCISRLAGIIGPDAWCNTPDGYLIFLGRNGLMAVPPGAVFSSGESSVAQPFSTKVIPAELKQIDPAVYNVQLIYDIVKDGIDVYLTPLVSGLAQHWYIDWPGKSYWQDMGIEDHGPSAVGYDAESGVLVGGRDGYVRQYDDNANTDDGEDIEGTCLIGPIQCGGLNLDGLVRELVGLLTKESAEVTWSLHIGRTAEEALNAAASASGTWSGGLNYTVRPRRRGAVAFLKLTGTGRWEFESADVVTEQLGKLRLP
jgi:hypothetical protein